VGWARRGLLSWIQRDWREKSSRTKVIRITQANHKILVCDGLHVTRVSRVNPLISVCDGLHLGPDRTG
jgi:hypothetical protein